MIKSINSLISKGISNLLLLILREPSHKLRCPLGSLAARFYNMMLERAFVGFTVLCLTAPAGEISERESRKATRVGYSPIRVLHGFQVIVSFWAHFPIQLWVARARSLFAGVISSPPLSGADHHFGILCSVTVLSVWKWIHFHGVHPCATKDPKAQFQNTDLILDRHETATRQTLRQTLREAFKTNFW